MDSSKPFPVLVEYSIKPEAKEGLRPSTEDFINWDSLFLASAS